MARWDDARWTPYVPAAERRRQASAEIAALKKKGREITPIVIEGRLIATTFWGKSWCKNLEAYSDYESRLPRGRTYVRGGSVVHLAIDDGRIEALVRGSSMYEVEIKIARLAAERWSAVVKECSGKIDSLVELLRGTLSNAVMAVVTDEDGGLFPGPDEIELSCSCPDMATMCKHVAAVLYGVGARLDVKPELLFTLRGVDPSGLLATTTVGRTAGTRKRRDLGVSAGAMAEIFGIELVDEGPKRRKRAR